MITPRFLQQGDHGLVVEFGQQIHPELVEQVRTLMIALRENPLPGILETIPTYRSLLVRYDPLRITVQALQHHIEDLLQQEKQQIAPAFVTEIPVCYGGTWGPDLEQVAVHAQKSVQEVIAFHTSADYLIYMLGFTPGFPYLGGLPREIACPRLATPRTAVPAGSVGIAETQTGIYPMVSPGGWQIIGRTPLRLFDPGKKDPVLLQAGDYLRFKSVTEEEYVEIALKVEQNRYVVKKTPKGGSLE